ncbi:polymorphic toxin-type HINT domain-containing protein [Nonomuraea sp. NPDC059023]|uniref:polymorphic toxin-type HINT domain-containing protein n=1 Tax=unclassified Nonomuraea TaxID=2593643 RepID=UPI00367F4231
MSRRSRLATFSAAVVLLLTHFHALPAAAGVAAADRRPGVQQERSVPGEKVPVKQLPKDPAMQAAVTTSPQVTWPSGTGDARLGAAGRARAGALPVWVTAPGAQQATVEVADRATTRRAGVDGLLIKVRQAAAARIDLDYSGFRHAYGGDWAARLRVVAYPGCFLTTPEQEACRTGTSIPTRNDPATSTLAADVGPAARSADGVFAVTAATGGSTGSYSATSLSPSAIWQVSAQTGDFTWNYPLRMPPSTGGPAPQVGLSYSSGGIDGRTASTNNQPSWAGEGFDFWPGYIERKYKSCADDGVKPKTGDQCWSSSNATMVLNGGGGELVRDDDTGAWKLKSDDGSKIEKLDGAANGDNSGEHWRVTTLDGTQYHFGLNRLPGWKSGDEETTSTWTMPVFGDDAGEPCHASTYAASWCTQAWRWNLDYVVDPSGNVISYYYGKETNRYARNLKTGTTYDRSGYLKRIDYGDRHGEVYKGKSPLQVAFTTAGRCVPGTACSTDQPKDWPDVPWDQKCADGDCPEKYSPTFWSTKRLAKITTRVLDGAGYRDVESWTLRHEFPKPGDGTSPALWLESITHTGGSSAMPPVNFDGAQLMNRVDGLEGLPPLYKYRVQTVHNETGGQVSVTYKPAECTRGTVPAKPDQNTKRCFPQQWLAPEGGEPIENDWFHKYVVAQVDQIDRTGGSPDQRTTYDYLGTPAWHYNEDEDLVPAERKTWSDWRGYERVLVRRGLPGEQRSESEFLYFRGMDGDHLEGGGSRDVSITDSDGVKVADHRAYRGQIREEIQRDGPGGAVVSRTVNGLWKRGPTAKHGGQEAYIVRQARVTGHSALAGGGFRTVEVAKEFDEYGLVTKTGDLGEAGAGDDQCVRHEYTRNTAKWIINKVGRIQSAAAPCSATPAPGDVLSDVRTTYDTRGLVTKVEELSGWNAGQPAYTTTSRAVYDANGRMTESYDALGRKSTTSYTPATGGPLTGVRTVNPRGHTATSELDPGWGRPTAEIDANERRTDLVYDGLGRLSKVWLPGRSKADGHTPTGEYSYLVRTNGPVVVTSTSVKPDGGNVSSFELYDGFLRHRQSQVPAPGAGRALADTVYDSRGLVAKRNTSYYNDQPPGTALHQAADNQVPAQTVFVRDGAERTTAEVFKVNGAERWRTSYTHGADWTTTTPPSGGTATAALSDARGRVSELRQYATGTPTGAYDATKHTYTPDGLRESTTDPAGNVWRNHYDVRDRLVKNEDPDRGATAYTYDAAGQLLTSTDARGRTLTYRYDDLGRATSLSEGSAKLAEWAYDAPLKGLPSGSTRYVGDDAYTSTITGYSPANKPTGSKVTIPASEGALAGTYEFGMSYNGDGSISKIHYPAAGGLPAESVSLGYDALGLPSTLTGAAPYVSETLYTKFAEPMQHTMNAGGKPAWLTNYYEEGTRRLERARVDRDDPAPQLADVGYTYDQMGNVLRLGDAVSRDTQCFEYDHLRRLTQAWTAADQCAAAPSNATVGGPQPYWDSYTYDTVGNRLTQVKHSPAGDTTSTYTQPAPGQPRPHTLSKVVTSGPAGERLDTYSYDAAGNMTTRVLAGEEQTLEWDAEGRLAKSTKAGKATTFVYDADGDRLLKHEPGTSTLSLGLMELNLDKSDGKVSALRYYGLGGAVAVRDSGGKVTYLTGDHQGTAQMAVDATTLQATRRTFTPFGEPRGQAPSAWPDRKGFVGGDIDASTGFTHLGAREYDPSAGRFISDDPISDTGDPQQLHGYAYANNSPATFNDASGLMYDIGGGGGGGGGGGSSTSSSSSSSSGNNNGGPSKDQIDQAMATKNKSFVDVVVEAGAEILLDLLGVNDIINCVGGDIGSCVSMVIGFLPWGKIFSVGADVAKGVVRVAKGFVKWQDDLKAADDVLRQADEAAAAAAKKGDDAASGTSKQADDAAETASSKGDPPAKKKTEDPGGSSSGGSCSSFTPDTPVLMGDGSRRRIDQVRIGDKVTATDPETGRTRPRTVVATIISDGRKDLVEVGVGDGTIVATANHPFWDEGAKEWVRADRLRPGTVLRDEDGGTVTVGSVRAFTRPQKVRNLTVATDHTYYVAGGDEDVLVHNRNFQQNLVCGVRAQTDRRKMAENRAALARTPVIQPQVSTTGLHQIPAFARKTQGAPPLVKLHDHVTKQLGQDPVKFASKLEDKVEKAEKYLGILSRFGELFG